MGEFELIERFFRRPSSKAALGMGDDCALLQAGPDMQLAVSCDMLVSGRHFLPDAAPESIGHKALAVNLSDLAACGARPTAFTLALALPAIDKRWLEAFARGLFTLADEHGCELIGGDTTRGPLNICITVFGEVPQSEGRSQALLRSGAKAGDDVFISGRVGDARYVLEMLQGKRATQAQHLEQLRPRLERPAPRVALGLALRGLASAAIDLSDGLLGDLGHVLHASGVGARLETEWIMTTPATGTALKSLGEAVAQRYALSGGDDYELLFTAAPAAASALQDAAQRCETRITRIGRIEAATGLRMIDARGREVAASYASFDHFV